MFRTLLVLIFLAACGVFFHHNSQDGAPAPAPAKTAATAPAKQEKSVPEKRVQEKRVVDDSSLQALKKALPAALFEKDVQPSIDQNRKEGLSADQIAQLLARLEGMGRALGGKTSEAVDKAVKEVEASLPSRQGGKQDMSEKTAEVASVLAKNAGEAVKESLPAIKEMSAEMLKGAVAILSQLLNAAAELLQK
ncbi:MAG: hypothetical protein IJ034_03395 [Mailhella sp.]|nr:hypothetical protein [Mailhella sp.]